MNRILKGGALLVGVALGGFGLAVAATTFDAVTTGFLGSTVVHYLNGSLQGVAVSATAPLPVAAGTTTTGGLSNQRVNAAATTNATSVKASAGQVYGYALCNAAATMRYVRLFNLAAAPTVGSSTPTQTIVLAASGGCATLTTTIGIAYATGIAFDVTGANGDADATAVTANDVTGAIYYR